MQTKKTDTSKSEKAAAVAGKTWTILKSETTAFVIGLLCVIFGVYLLLAFSSFFFTGGTTRAFCRIPTRRSCWKRATAYRTMPEHGEHSWHNS